MKTLVHALLAALLASFVGAAFAQYPDKQSGGFARVEIGQIEAVVTKNQQTLLEAWNEYFRD